ncbi:unnamed protein product [Eruca vesicaria subsp. sativa]|uniref:Uncharacterized protein n=1 Tax=Eruca vesicaria subsp. sativa TaxID=29727 RepID=A0ABC8L7Y7_ERUVS|nr:unnamed protein product [Eruca vesicaria subsp. sativa]
MERNLIYWNHVVNMGFGEDQGGRGEDYGRYLTSKFHLQLNRNLKEVKSLLSVKGELLGRTKLISLSLLEHKSFTPSNLELRWSSTM